MSIVVWIVVGTVAGWLAASAIRGEDPLGVTGHIVLGVIGAVSGGFLAGALFDVDPLEGPVELISTGAALVAALLVALSADVLVRRATAENDAAGQMR